MSLPGITRDYRRGAAQRLGFDHLRGTMARHEPGVADAFARTSGLLLRDVMASSNSGHAWSGGLLNRNGAPLEVSFSTMSYDVRYTVEVGLQESPPERRLACIDALLDELGVDPSWDGVARRFPELQRDLPLQFGAWLGVRHQRAISGAATTFKIYAELPAQDGPAASRLLSDYLGPSVMSVGEVELTLVGAAPEADRCEFYFEWAQRKPAISELGQLMSGVGLEARLHDLLELVFSFQFRADAEADTLPEAGYGFSYSALPGCRDPMFSILVFASDLAGGDGYLRRQILAEALRRSWKLGCYGVLTQPFAQHLFKSAFHNMLTFSVGPDGKPGLQVSVSPPPEFIHDH